MGIIKNLMKMVYIDRISPFTAKKIRVSVKFDDIVSLNLEMLNELKELIKEERRINLEYLNDDKIKLHIGDTWYRVVPLDNIAIDDEAVFALDEHDSHLHVNNHDIWFNFYLDENIHIWVCIAPGELQLGDIYTRLHEFQVEISELAESPFATAGPYTGTSFSFS